MKRILLSVIITITFAGITKAQTFSEAAFKEKLGKTGTLCDTVYSSHTFSDTLTLLNMGKAYPNQKYTVAIKGNKIKLDWAGMKGKPLCVTGMFILYKNKPEIEVSEPEQVNAK